MVELGRNWSTSLKHRLAAEEAARLANPEAAKTAAQTIAKTTAAANGERT
jgi:hypothetical protein